MSQPRQNSTDETPRQDPLRYGGPVQLVTTPIIWWSGLGFLLVFGVLLWAIVARIPVVSTGKGAFSYPFRIQSVLLPTSQTNSRVKVVYKKAGALVSKNEILAKLTVPESEDDVQESKEKLRLAEIKLQATKQENLPMITIAKDQSEAFQMQTNAYRKLLNEGIKLRNKGIISETTLIQTENNYNQSKNSYIQEIDNIQNYNNTIESARQSLREAQLQLNQDTESLENDTIVRSPFDGFVLDVQYIGGSPVSSKPLMNLLDISGFKPENVPNNLRLILKQLENSYKLSKEVNQKFNANKVTSNNSIIPLYILAYFPQNSGRQISVGMKARILPDNVKANTVGTLRGEVESVYPMPATTNSASSILGSTSLANELVKDNEAPKQVLIKLFPNPKYPSGYEWISGDGPSVPSQIPTVGGMASINVIVEQKPPIVLALPALRKAFGLPQGTN